MPETRIRGVRLTTGAGFALRFLAIFAVLIGVTIRFGDLFEHLSEFWAVLLARLLDLTGLGPATVRGVFVSFGSSRLEVVLECTGAHLFAMWLALILAFPATWRHRLHGAIVAALVIPAVNVVRLWTAAWVLHVKPGWFHLVHAYCWQTIMILVVLVLGAWWMARSQQTASVVAAGDPGSRV